jgi:hypothetical protein
MTHGRALSPLHLCTPTSSHDAVVGWNECNEFQRWVSLRSTQPTWLPDLLSRERDRRRGDGTQWLRERLLA